MFRMGGEKLNVIPGFPAKNILEILVQVLGQVSAGTAKRKAHSGKSRYLSKIICVNMLSRDAVIL